MVKNNIKIFYTSYIKGNCDAAVITVLQNFSSYSSPLNRAFFDKNVIIHLGVFEH